MTKDIPRYSDRPLPPYSYVPGLSPHPVSDPRGHSFGVHMPAAEPLLAATYRSNETYLYAIDLFNHGFYWEAHEFWESLWQAAGRTGATADFLKGLIKLTAAGVKAREGRAAGVRQHAQRATDLFGVVADEADARGRLYGMPLCDLETAAECIARDGQALAGGSIPSAQRLPLVLRLG